MDEQRMDEGASPMPDGSGTDKIEEAAASANSVSEELSDRPGPESAGVLADPTITPNDESEMCFDEGESSAIIPINSRANLPRAIDDLGIVLQPTDAGSTTPESTVSCSSQSQVHGDGNERQPVGGGDERSSQELSIGDLLTLVENEGHELFCDRSGQPRLRISGDPLNRTWPVNSRRAESWIAEVFHRCKVYPKPAVIRQIVNVLEGIAWKNYRPLTDAGYLEAIAAEPLIGVLDDFLETDKGGEFSPTELLAKLSGVAKDRYENVWDIRWPKGPSAFTRRLRENAEILSELGIFISFRREAGRRFLSVSKNSPQNDGVDVMPSPTSSGHNPNSEQGFPKDDGNVGPNWRQLLGDELEAKMARPE